MLGSVHFVSLRLHVSSLSECKSQDGTKKFHAQDFSEAAELYVKALEQASKMPNHTTGYQRDLPALRLKLYLNLAMVGKAGLLVSGNSVVCRRSHCHEFSPPTWRLREVETRYHAHPPTPTP